MSKKTAPKKASVLHQPVDATMVLVVVGSFFVAVWMVAHLFFR